MGGRGGGSSKAASSAGPAAAAAQAVDSSPEEEFRRWLQNPRDISSSSFLASDGLEKVRMGLPDREAIITKEGRFFVARDDTTDQQIFVGTTREGIYRQASVQYGVPIRHTNSKLQTSTYGKREENLRSTPAARSYGVS